MQIKTIRRQLSAFNNYSAKASPEEKAAVQAESQGLRDTLRAKHRMERQNKKKARHGH